MTKAYLALGSNLENPVRQVQVALNELSLIPQTLVMCSSKLYQTPPVGKLDQPDFINAVAEVETGLCAVDLLQALFAIEAKHFRVRTEKNGPRTLDIDLLLFGNEVIGLPFLTVPHPRLKERAFVVVPLAEIASDLVLPCGTHISKLIHALHSSVHDMATVY